VKAILLLALAACDPKTFGGTPPQGFCPIGSTTDPGPGCTVALADVAIDGDNADWANVPGTTCPDCQPGFVAAFRALRTPDGRLAFRADMTAGPLADASHSYHVFFEPIRGPTNFIDLRVQPGIATTLDLDGVPLAGIPVDTAFGAGGLEFAIPIAALPFRGLGAYAALEVLDSTGAWQLAQARYAFVQACWDPTSPVCQPN
jgi:hypothetical protein